MARLIPSFMDEHTPPGECDVFNLVAAGPDGWVALHSLDLSPWNRSLRTEVDFVVIIPDTGILCIEVKSHENIIFDGDRWYPSEIKRSPFKQAADARYIFYRRLIELAPQFKRLPVVHCCIFPKAPFDLAPNLAVQPWELIDCRLFRSFQSGLSFCAELKARMKKSIEADISLSPLETSLSQTQIDFIIKCCAPVQKWRPAQREEIRQREEQLSTILRAQQKPVLQLVNLNPRLAVSGGAGTGKTLIAMEVARRAAEKGRRVALLSFNRLIGDWMEKRMHDSTLPPNLIIGPALRVISQMAGLEIPENPSHGFWETELPLKLEEKLTDPDFKLLSAFDYLVIDEAQDFLARPRLWDCVSQFLSGGVTEGSFVLFGDFENQVLSDKRVMDEVLNTLVDRAHVTRWHLNENCRNYRIVGDTAVNLSGLQNVYSGYLRAGGGLQNYDINFYEHDRAQLDKIHQWLKEFGVLGYKPSDITLLSLRSPENSAAFRMKQEGFKFRPFWQAGEFTGFASIHAFKGMENKIIILTDIELGGPDFHRHLFYTGMTRATDAVRVACDTSSKETLISWITGIRHERTL